MSDLTSLPVELYRKIAESVCHEDLKALRLVNKQFGAVTAWPLFKTLHFSGPASLRSLPGDDDKRQRNNVEYGRLHETIEAALPLARYVKTFHFNPAYYREGMHTFTELDVVTYIAIAGFWQDYRTYLETQMGEPIDEPDLEDEDYEGSDEEADLEAAYERAVERIQEERNSRPAREAPLIE